MVKTKYNAPCIFVLKCAESRLLADTHHNESTTDPEEGGGGTIGAKQMGWDDEEEDDESIFSKGNIWNNK